MSQTVKTVIADVTSRITERSRASREAYLAMCRDAGRNTVHREQLSCGNLAHGFAASPADDKAQLKGARWPNIAIVSAYNDMLSAHQPLGTYPDIIKSAVREVGAVAQVAGGVPAMCDGVTQGQAGMDLSLFSRDVIAMSTAVGLSHNMFDGVICLGVCDKIVPGLLIGALRFGHLPVAFIPAGPMPSGLPNAEKARVRQLFAEGKVGRDELLEAESDSYHSPGTCTFYGTANSNQMFMEIMGLHMPGSAFINPGTPQRDAMVKATAQRVAKITALGDSYTPLCELVNEKSVVNAIVGLHATGGSTNHTIHLVAMARAAGIIINWDDMDQLAQATPLLTRIYPNGLADVNHFHAAGGMGFLIRELLDAGLLHQDVLTVQGEDLRAYTHEPTLTNDGGLAWRPAPSESQDPQVLGTIATPFKPDGGLKVLSGNIGRAVIKTSAVAEERYIVEAPAKVFHSQADMIAAFKAGDMDKDVVAVVRFQGPKACGMPELHKLTPQLGVLQDKGFKVALVTDGRMSGASGKVPAAIHVSPEAQDGGPIAKIRDGDIIRVDAIAGTLEALVDADEWASRSDAICDMSSEHVGMGRELFAGFRGCVTAAEEGAMSFGDFDHVATAGTKLAEPVA